MIKNKTILVTGCYGFVAQHLINKLLLSNNKIIGIYNKKYQPKIFKINNTDNKNLIIKKIDIRNKKKINSLFKRYKFDFCFHLAAISQVLTSNTSPNETFQINIFGTINLLETSRLITPKIKFIFSSTDKAYGESKILPYLEDYPLNANNPYDASKACADILARTYAKSFNLSICVTRFVNIYGPGDVNWDRIIPGTIKSIINNKKPVLRSNGKFLRDYLYIDDVINGYILIGKKMMISKKLDGFALNFGTGKPITVIDLVKKILKILNKKKNYFFIKNDAKNEIKDQYSGYKLANKKINWKPKILLENGLLKTYSWYKNKKV
jgi:CDP-glucose 4,6-dehydratase